MGKDQTEARGPRPAWWQSKTPNTQTKTNEKGTFLAWPQAGHHITA